MTWSFSLSFSFSGSKHDVAESMDAKLEEIEAATGADSVQVQQFVLASSLIDTAAVAIPSHVAGISVSASGHATEHDYQLSVSVNGIHLQAQNTTPTGGIGVPTPGMTQADEAQAVAAPGADADGEIWSETTVGSGPVIQPETLIV